MENNVTFGLVLDTHLSSIIYSICNLYLNVIPPKKVSCVLK